MDKYYKSPNVPASYTGIDKISRTSKRKRNKVAQELNHIETYSLHKPLKRRFKRSRVIVGGQQNQYDADLFQLTSYNKWNEGYSFILIVIDVFSRYLMVAKLKSKQGLEVSKALKKILEKRPVYNLRTDMGTEFVNKHVSKVLQTKSIKHILARNTEVKANYAERVIRTISNKLFRYFSQKNTYIWIDVIQDIVNSYNATYHRSIGMAPNDVTKEKEAELWKKLYMDTASAPKDYKLNEGDVVRMSVLKGNFQKERNEQWTRELFIIISKYRRSGIPLYKVKDWAGDEISGSFYSEELQLVHVDETTEYKIEKILKTRVRKGKKELLVSWLGWGSKYDSYIDANLVK